MLELDSNEMKARSDQVSEWIKGAFGERVAFTLTMLNKEACSISIHGPTDVVMVGVIETLHHHIMYAVKEMGHEQALSLVRGILEGIARREGINTEGLSSVIGAFR